MNKAYIDEECIMCSTYGKFLSNRSSDVLIMKQSELSIEDIKDKNVLVSDEQGLGDTIHKFTSITGLDKVAQGLSTRLTGKKDCGCNKRKNWLNQQFPYKTK